jgi:hypothetical protein
MPRTLAPESVQSRAVRHCRNRFLRFYPDGFDDPSYVELERSYKWEAHLRWRELLDRPTFEALLSTGDHQEIARRAVRLESRTNLLFSFEKMAIRDAVTTAGGARLFANGLHAWIYGAGAERGKFERWIQTLQQLPRRQTRVATWPLATVFGFIARPKVHMFLKPTVTRAAADAYGYDFAYRSGLQWDTYASLLGFARRVREDMADLGPRDMIDAQGFIWVQGSAEYD